MAIKNSRLGHQFAVDSVPGQKDIDTLENITKRREKILYKSKVSPANANVAYLANSPKASSINVSVVDKSTSLNVNRNREEDILTKTTVSFTVETINFQVTDVFTDESASIEQLPLFLEHVISVDHADRVSTEDLTLATDTRILNVELLNANKVPINIEEYKVDLTKGIVYTNLETSFTSRRKFTLYYLKYTIKDSANTIKTYTVLLDNQTVYKTADLDDLDSFLDIIADGRKVYLITNNETNFTITLPVLAEYSIRSINSSRIQLLKPAAQDITNSWLLRITNGDFLENVNGNLRRYHIAEFLDQAWDPEAPIKKITGEIPTVITSSILKTDHTDIKEDTDVLDLYVSLTISDKRNRSLAAYTTDPNLENTVSNNGFVYRKWNSIDQIGIKSIDHSTGLIEVQGVSLKTSHNIAVDYYYIETNYELTSIDFNPANNADILNYRIAVVLNDSDVDGTETQTLYQLKINKEGRVIESDWPGFDSTVTGYTDGQPIYFDSYPFYLNPASGHYIFLEDFSVESTLANPLDNFLVLGTVTVSEALHPSETTRIDSRKRGGGIIDRLQDAISIIQPESEWYWDIGRWDGKPFPGNASYMVEVPVDILEGAGGRFKSNEVTDIVNRHTAAGIYPVKRAYGVDVTITGVVSSVDSILVGWTSYGY